MKRYSQILLIFSVFLFSMCNSNNSRLTDTTAIQRNENEEVKVNEQQKPTLMILPSDAMLQRLGCVKTIDNQGVTSYQRDYQKAFIKDSDLKFVISEIQSQFVRVGFPLEDLEQSLKSLNNTLAADNAGNIMQDSKTMLLSAVHPDIILEMDYQSVIDNRSRNLNSTVTYSLKAIDSYSNKTIASIQNTGISNSDGITKTMKKEIENNIFKFTDQIKTAFADIVKNGREISLRIAMSSNSKIKFTDLTANNSTLDNFIYTWLKNNTFGGTFKRDMATDIEIRYKNIRIKTLDQNGQPYTAFDFANKLISALRSTYSINCKNDTQSLSDAFILIDGK